MCDSCFVELNNKNNIQANGKNNTSQDAIDESSDSDTEVREKGLNNRDSGRSLEELNNLEQVDECNSWLNDTNFFSFRLQPTFYSQIIS